MTMVELLVVISIIGLLIAITIPAVQAARNSARKSLCANHLRQVGLSILNYEASQQHFPPGQTWIRERASVSPFSYSWAVHVLPYLEEDNLRRSIDLKRPFLHPTNLDVVTQGIPTYICPATSLREPHRNTEERLFGIERGQGNGLACIDYLGISGPSKKWTNPATDMDYGPQRGILIGIKGLEHKEKLAPYVRARQVIDGLSKTACVTECSGRGLDKDGDFHGTWASGKNISHVSKLINQFGPPKAWSKERIYSQHSGGAQFLFCDNSVRFLPNGTKKKILKAICSRDGEEVEDEVF